MTEKLEKIKYAGYEELFEAKCEEIEQKDKEIERLSKEVDMWNRKYNEQFNIIDELEKELDNLIIFNQSDINCNHYTLDDWKDSKLIGNMLYKMKPVSFLAQELKDKLNKLKEDKE